jgi:uncharacterized protein
MRKLLILIALFMALSLSGGSVLAYESPGKPTGFVTDFTQTLSAAERETLENKLVTFQQETSTEIAVAIIPNLSGDSIENVANELFREWGIGGSENNNGILLLTAKDDRQARIEVGYGLEGAVPDITAKHILEEEVLSEFKEGNYTAGITRGVDALIAATRGEYTAAPQEGDTVDPLGILFGFGIFAVIWLGAIFARSKSWWAGGVVGGVMGIANAVLGAVPLPLIGAILAGVGLIGIGLLFDYVVSKNYRNVLRTGGKHPWWGGGGWGGGSSSGGFGGFGGGSSGGGGASGSW